MVRTCGLKIGHRGLTVSIFRWMSSSPQSCLREESANPLYEESWTKQNWEWIKEAFAMVMVQNFMQRFSHGKEYKECVEPSPCCTSGLTQHWVHSTSVKKFFVKPERKKAGQNAFPFKAFPPHGKLRKKHIWTFSGINLS